MELIIIMLGIVLGFWILSGILSLGYAVYVWWTVRSAIREGDRQLWRERRGERRSTGRSQ